MTEKMKRERGEGLSYEEKRKRGLLAVSDIHDHYYGEGGKLEMKKKAKVQKAKREDAVVRTKVAAAVEKGVTRNELMLKAKDLGIKNFRVLNKEELAEAIRLHDIKDEAGLQKVIDGAVERWKAGWKTKNK